MPQLSEETVCQFVVSLWSHVACHFIVSSGFVISVVQIIRFINLPGDFGSLKDVCRVSGSYVVNLKSACD